MRRSPRPSAHTRTRTRTAAALAALALALPLTACGGGSGSSDDGRKADPAAVRAALDRPAEITFWTWVPNIDKTVALFEKKYPKIKVNLVNAGRSKDEYTKLTTVLKAGTGAPDVVQVEYFALPQFAMTKSLVDLADYGAAGLKDEFAGSAWSQVSVAGGIYGIPQDTGPMAMFYRKDVLDRFGATPPSTWEEYGALARKIHDADPNVRITYVDPGDAGTSNSLIWQSGGKPYTVDGATDVTVDLANDAGAKAYAGTWGPLIENKLVDSTASWNDEWWKSMASGRYATWLAGAWAPAVLEQNIPQSAGQWSVAPMPGGVSAENGGSSVAVTTQARNKEASVAFAQWLGSDPEAVRSLNSEVGLFPATRVLLDDPGFRGAAVPFFPGAQPNEVFADMSKAVRPGWQYLPFQVYANSVFKDSVGQALQPGGNLPGALATWQDRVKAYGREQGFTVK
ncbi:ABC transporter substrate-binding protein [Streptomyces sp. NPDC058412]|uniref:ABC transporter substrate-binding protein n=1 Tax=Streptomyces sp. NPDC058412 TaxID=3346486 RepID=UPI00364B98D3